MGGDILFTNSQKKNVERTQCFEKKEGEIKRCMCACVIPEEARKKL